MKGIDLGPGGEDEFIVTRDERAQIIKQEWVTYFQEEKTTIKDNVLCDPWWGLENLCVAVFTNPGDTVKEMNNYVFYTLTGLFTFSVFQPE